MLLQNILYVYLLDRLIGLVGRVFTNGPGDLGHTKDFKNGIWYLLA